MTGTTIPQATLPTYVATNHEATLAYYILAALKPEMLHASPVARSSEIDRILAACQSWRKGTGMLPADRLDRRAHEVILSLMDADDLAALQRARTGGW